MAVREEVTIPLRERRRPPPVSDFGSCGSDSQPWQREQAAFVEILAREPGILAFVSGCAVDFHPGL